MNRTELSDEEFIKIVETAQSMFYAAKLCGMAYTSFIRRAKKFGIYKPNQGGVGIVKNNAVQLHHWKKSLLVYIRNIKHIN